MGRIVTQLPQTIETTKPEDVNDFKMTEKMKSNRASNAVNRI